MEVLPSQLIQAKYCYLGFVRRIDNSFFYICDALHDLLPSLQFEKHEKCTRSSVTLSKVVSLNLQPVTLLHVCFLRFLICSNSTKSCKALHLIEKLACFYIAII